MNDSTIKGVVAAKAADAGAMLLFGSVARGDADANSDVDVLCVVPDWRPQESYGRVNLCFYTESQLLRMRESDSLFFTHLYLEGRVLVDPAGVFASLFDRFEVPTAFGDVFNVAQAALPLFNVTELVFWKYATPLQRGLVHLSRTWVYARVATDEGELTFSLSRLAPIWPTSLVGLIMTAKSKAPSWVSYRAILETLANEVGVSLAAPFGSLSSSLEEVDLRQEGVRRIAMRLQNSAEYHLVD